MGDPENREFDPGENRVEAEINHVANDTARKDWPEVLQELQSEVPRELDEALSGGILNAKQRVDYFKTLTGVADKVKAEDDFEQKQQILDAIEKIQKKLEIS
ncbi:hypothetical protein KKF61_05415 [Patescibacteria group bacterium]|nr:hypothetical protein [Patescibacteria group bacterium]MBU0964408.1 hypothetical protein [Patescibacteria group bacterium]